MPEGIWFGSQKTGNDLAPGWEFLAGLQDRMVTDKFSQHDWITNDTLFNMPMNFTSTENLIGKVNLEPLNNLRVDLTLQRIIAQKKPNTVTMTITVF